MDLAPLGFFSRVWLALWLPFKLVIDGVFAAKVRGLARGEAQAALEEAPIEHARAQPAPSSADADGALHLLAILQRDGRFVDFLQEEVTSFSDAEIGAAARVVHDGCRKALGQYLQLSPVRTEGEGAPVTIESGFDPTQIRLTGNVIGQPPFKGRLAHHGWLVREVNFPQPPAGQNPAVIAPAEVEL